MNVHLRNIFLFCRRVIISHFKEHIGSNAKIVLHRCKKEIWYPKWTKLINRQGFSVSKHTRVCSNHFKYGQPREQEPIPLCSSKVTSVNLREKQLWNVNCLVNNTNNRITLVPTRQVRQPKVRKSLIFDAEEQN